MTVFRNLGRGRKNEADIGFAAVGRVSLVDLVKQFSSPHANHNWACSKLSLGIRPK